MTTQLDLPLTTERKPKPTQVDRIRDHLQSGQTITALDALDLYGCFRLAARIDDLKAEGMAIASEMITTRGGAKIKRYWKGETNE